MNYTKYRVRSMSGGSGGRDLRPPERSRVPNSYRKRSERQRTELSDPKIWFFLEYHTVNTPEKHKQMTQQI